MKALVFLNKKNDYSKKIVLFLRKKKFKIKIIWSGENYENLSKKIGSWKGDFIFHLSSYYKIPQKTLNKAKKLSINFHTALPKYPGRGGYSWALFNEDKYYGITVHKINNKIDNGKIIYVSKFIISNSESLDSLIQKTKFFQFVTFKKIINEYVIPKYIYNKNEILKKSNNKWSKKIYKISMLNNLQKVNIKLPKKNINYLEKIIRSTNIGNHKPKLIINKRIFTLE